MTDELNGQVAIVTGASSGMGKAVAEKLASAGCAVVLAARRKDRLDALASQIKAAGGRALAVPADVRNYGDVRGLVEKSISEFGQVDIMVNNAGYGLVGGFLDSKIEDITDQIDANLNSVCYGCHAVLPHMIERKSGMVINVASIASTKHFPYFAAYTAAKWGVLGLTRSIYEEVRCHGIRMTTLCPAAVNTEFGDVAGLNLPWSHEDEIQAKDIADIVYSCVTLPKNVQVESMVVWPVCQPTA
jgi:NADP-dependent 3-hydroxy acid dehydrogenase YdfG